MKKFLFTLLPILLIALSVESSVDTTARVKGTVNVDDAVITAVHIPTNTTKTVTAIGGNFNINFFLFNNAESESLVTPSRATIRSGPNLLHHLLLQMDILGSICTQLIQQM